MRGARHRFACNAFFHRLVEGGGEQRQLAVQLELAAQQRVTLRSAVGRQRRQTEAVDALFSRLARSQPHPLQGGLDRCGQARGRGCRHRGRRTAWSSQYAATDCDGSARNAA
jgi:hypothetical protein